MGFGHISTVFGRTWGDEKPRGDDERRGASWEREHYVQCRSKDHERFAREERWGDWERELNHTRIWAGCSFYFRADRGELGISFIMGIGH